VNQVTTRLSKYVPNLAAIVLDSLGCGDKLQTYGHAEQMLAPAFVYRARTVETAMHSILWPTNLRHFKTAMLPDKFGLTHSQSIVNLAISRFDDEQLRLSAKWPALQHIVLRRVSELHTYLSGGRPNHATKFPTLCALTYAPWFTTNVGGTTSSVLEQYAEDMRLAAQVGAFWHAAFGNCMMLDMHTIYRTCYNIANEFVELRHYDPHFQPHTFACNLEAHVLHLLSSVPLVLLFPRASVCATYVPIEKPVSLFLADSCALGQTHMPFVSFLLQYGGRLHDGSRLQIVESAFMQHLIHQGEPLPCIDLAHLPTTEPRNVAAARWLHRNLSYSPAFEDTL
jgi:hypothetical protein